MFSALDNPQRVDKSLKAYHSAATDGEFNNCCHKGFVTASVGFQSIFEEINIRLETYPLYNLQTKYN